MGLFDVFGKDRKTKNERAFEEMLRSTSNTHSTQNKAPVSVFKPNCFEDVEGIIDALKLGKTAIVHLTDIKHETQIRVIDMLSGAIFALDGGVYEMEKNVFMFSPSGLEIY